MEKQPRAGDVAGQFYQKEDDVNDRNAALVLAVLAVLALLLLVTVSAFVGLEVAQHFNEAGRTSDTSVTTTP